MKELINQIKAGGHKNILIIGDVMLDEYSFGSVSRISPEAPVPVLREERKEWCLGGAGNVAANCKHIGCDIDLIGVIGDGDQEASKFLSMLKELGIATDGLVKSGQRVTTSKKRFLAKSHQMFRMDAESTNVLSEEEFLEVVSRFDRLLKPASIILISDYAKGVVTQELIAHVCKKARQLGCTVMVDPKGPHFAKYQGVDFLKPNANEFKQMVEFFKLPTEHSLEENGRAIGQLLSLKGLIITLGEKGILYISPEYSIFSPAHKREVYDLTGAGDTVFAFLALSFAHGLSLENALLLANRAASVAVSHLKTYPVSLDELVDRSLESTEKIYYDWARLKIELDWQRSGNKERKKVVLTNGCFDILHPGHIHTLKEAKRQGDILVVALNTDESIARLKGPSRPINNLEFRCTMMAALGVVDFVVSFDQDTPQELIDYIKPDVLVKGGDYKKESIVGYDIVTAYGGSVYIIDFVPGHSTTSIIASINKV